MPKKNEIIEKIGLVVLLVATLFLTGCTPKPTDSEIYSVSYVVHDINATTQTVLSVPDNKYGEYRFDYGMPGSSPISYDGLWFFFSPGQFGAGCYVYPILAGTSQTLFTYEENPVSEYYRHGGLKVDREVKLNYIPAGNYFDYNTYGNIQPEIVSGIYYDNSGSPWEGYVAVQPEEKKNFSFGGPYTPGSVMNEKEYSNIIKVAEEGTFETRSIKGYSIKLRGEILSGINTKVKKRVNFSLCTEPVINYNDFYCGNYMWGHLETPKYEIYKNGEKAKEGELIGKICDVCPYQWDKNALWYGIGSENANYIVNISIQSYYPTYNMTFVRAEFSTDKEDSNPPWISELFAEPEFEEGSDLEVKFIAHDDSQLSKIKVFASNDERDWIEVSNLAVVLGASLNESKIIAKVPASGERINLRIELSDFSGNNQSYTILPISLNKREIFFELSPDKEVISPGTKVKFSGKVSDDSGKGVGNLLLNIFYNGKIVGKAYADPGRYTRANDGGLSYIEPGNFSFSFDVPADYTPEMNLSIITEKAGVYPQKEQIISGFGQVFDRDVAVLELTAPDVLFVGNNTFNVTIANVGGVAVDAALQILYVPVTWDGSEYYAANEAGSAPAVTPEQAGVHGRTLAITIPVRLELHEIKNMIFNASIGGLPESTQIDLTEMKIIANLTMDDDKNINNNAREVIREIFATTDAGISMDYSGAFIVGEDKKVTLTISNKGIANLKNINYTLEASELVKNKETREIIEVNKTVLASGIIESLKKLESITKKITVSFDSKGNYRLRANVKVDGDVNANNDIFMDDVYAEPRGARLSLWIESNLPNRGLIVGRENNLTLHISNHGNEITKNANYKVYVAGGYCSRFNECENKQLLFSEDFTLGKQKDYKKNFSYTPSAEGYVTFIVEYNADNLVNSEEERRVYRQFFVKRPGADVGTALWLDGENIVGEQINISFSVRNIGIETARNVNYSLCMIEGDYEKSEILEKCRSQQPLKTREGFELKEDEVIKDIFEFLPEKEGMVRFTLIANAENDVNNENNIATFQFYVEPRGARLSSWVKSSLPGRRLIVGRENNLTLHISNHGNEITKNANYKVYVADRYCSRFNECDNKQLLFSEDFTLGKQKDYKKNFSYTPSAEGYVTFIFEYNADNLIDSEEKRRAYYQFFVKRPGADLNVWLSVPKPQPSSGGGGGGGSGGGSGGTTTATPVESTEPEPTESQSTEGSSYPIPTKVSVGEMLNLSVNIDNIGTETARNVNYTLKALEYSCDSEYKNCNLVDERIIKENQNIELPEREGIHEFFEFVPEKEGIVLFVLNASAENDVDNSNNGDSFSLNVLPRGADLSAYIETPDMLIVNQTNNIKIQIYNGGSEKTLNGTLRFYVIDNPECIWSDECALPAPILSKEIELNVGESKTEQAEYTPEKEGYIKFIVILNASNEILPNNNIYQASRTISKSGPNLEIGDLNIYNLQIIKGEKALIEGEIFNHGNENATDVVLSVFTRENNKGAISIGQNEPEFMPLASIPVGKVEAGNNKPFSFVYVPEKKGNVEFKFNLSLKEEDSNPFNNIYYLSKEIYNNGHDVAVENAYAKLMVNEKGKIYAHVKNVGNESLENVNVSLFINDALIDTKRISIDVSQNEWERLEEVIFDYTPHQKGRLRFKINVSLEENEEDVSDNVFEEEILVSSIDYFNLSVSDSKNNPVMRLAFSESLESGMQIINTTEAVIVPYLDDGATMPSLILARILKTDFVLGNDLDLFNFIRQVVQFHGIKGSNPNKVISDYIENISQDGKTYYGVFANRPTFEYNETGFECILPIEEAQAIGLNSSTIGDYGISYCERFNFENKKCEQSWEKLNETDIGLKGDFYMFFALGGTGIKAEAFAISDSSELVITSGEEQQEEERRPPSVPLEKRKIVPQAISTSQGGIFFSGEVDLSRLVQNPEVASQNIQIAPDLISINTGALPELKNAPAHLVLKNVDFHIPQIIRNGEICSSDICSNIEYDKNKRTLEFDVSGFSSYRAVEGCGDGMCNSANGESCNSCSADCGKCGKSSGTTGRVTTLSCTPKWKCSWGPCKNNLQEYQCVDLVGCENSLGKPEEKTRACFTRSECVDNDGDSYGMGIGCIGSDINDNDPAVNVGLKKANVLQSIFNPPEDEKQSLFPIYVLVLGLVISGVVVSFIINRANI